MGRRGGHECFDLFDGRAAECGFGGVLGTDVGHDEIRHRIWEAGAVAWEKRSVVWWFADGACSWLLEVLRDCWFKFRHI